jgi:putative ABC transport system permease protein
VGGFNALGTLVGDGATVTAATGASGPTYAEVLARGGAVVPWSSVRDDGTAVVSVTDANTQAVLRRIVVPAVALPRSGVNGYILSPQAAARLKQPVDVVAVVALGKRPPSAHAEDLARNAVQNTGVSASLTVERGYQSRYGVGLLALLLGSSIIVIGASGTATGLAAADGRADLGTLAAVGASPSTRRTLAAFQSAVTAGLGTVLGVLAGLVPGVGVVRAINAAAHTSPLDGPWYPLVLPWTNVLVTLLVVPLIAALAAAALTRSRLPMVRRIA